MGCRKIKVLKKDSSPGYSPANLNPFKSVLPNQHNKNFKTLADSFKGSQEKEENKPLTIQVATWFFIFLNNCHPTHFSCSCAPDLMNR